MILYFPKDAAPDSAVQVPLWWLNMPAALLLALQFVASAAAVVVAGSYLARYADAIGDRTGIGGLWIGTVLLAAATSLPELGTDVFAVRLGATDLALGDLFGSSMANMLILALLDLGFPTLRLVQKAAYDNLLSAALAIILTAVAMFGLLAPSSVSLFGLGAESWLMIAIYLVGSRVVYRRSTAVSQGPAAEPGPKTPTLRMAILGFAVAAAAILIAAPFFARSAQQIAERSGYGNTFVGTWLMGLCTSLPEFVATLAAVRLRAFDLAVGNLFGSNAFNMILIGALDLAHGGHPVLAIGDPAHAITGLLAIILMTLSIAAILFRAERSYTLIEPSSAVMLLTYILGLLLVYSRALHGGGG
jgi:cation:H+ antiporter